ncbi:UvrD-helicase domain-containing protein [Bacillus sinesaloumensis]|uniref:UvrD-helicase domain-containing protein n=1 Tax=Litchfieldia sinesaloumensis TaxID=1926280 RepID=UPI00135638B5|nr:UvrD-helicase domain-containing protein [Bacillus sinesaloumensis]
MKLKLRPEKQVIRILQSSTYIEQTIKRSYQKFHEQIERHPNVRNEQMPIFVSFLYDKIIDLKKLPSNKEFRDLYMNDYYSHIREDELIYFAYLYRIDQAYDSLVRDLHFYFKLTESKNYKFDDVQLNYVYDIEAKQDLVVTIGEKKLGLQLFKGNDTHIPNKKMQTARRRINPGYRDYFLPLHGSKTNPQNIGTEQHPFYAYSDNDVELIYKELTIQSDTSNSIDELEKYVLPSAGSQTNVNEPSKQPKHSLIYVGNNNPKDYNVEIDKLLSNGVRVEWISPYKGKGKDNLRIHESTIAENYNFYIQDGMFNKEQKKLLQQIGDSSTFNFEQYAVEHASLDKHLMVEAGAGSGKTETMISRIIYLLHTDKVDSLSEVVMITFTNEAADNMKSKLAKRLLKLFEITKKIQYINWSEEVTAMSILTIPSYSKTLIQDFSSELGMGRNFSVHTLKREREELIAGVLDEYVSEHSLTYHDLGKLKDYEIIDLIDHFWNQLEQKGIIFEDHHEIQWGTVPSNELEKTYYHLLKDVIRKCEMKFKQEKLNKDVLTVNDLTQKISEFKPHLNKQQMSKPFRFLFVDEFQDTDDVQIDLVYMLTTITEAQLFVVGDIKQSIYRFRGANYTAFALLTKKLGEHTINQEYKLKKNYRTDAAILNPLEDIFDVWRNHLLQVLPKSDDTEGRRLVPTLSETKYAEPYKVDTETTDIFKATLDLYRELIREKDDEKQDKPVELAILVRTNYQAQEMRKLLENLRKNHPEIVFEVTTGGSLFKSKAAKDLLILINALCYMDEPESFYALRQTAFSTKSFNPAEFISYEGNRDEVMNQLSHDEVKGYSEALKDLRIKPTLHAIYRILMNNPYQEVLKAMNMQDHEIQRYRLNLYRILEIAGETLEPSMLGILQLRDWLKIQVATNRDEDEMEVEIYNVEKLIRVMTVHKAKGLEFDTVFLPYTNQALVKKSAQNMIVVRENEEIKAGWKSNVGTEINEIKSTNYDDLKTVEDNESIREEARLLYVALTRAKHRLVVKCVKPKYDKNNLYNWSELIRLKEEEKR